MIDSTNPRQLADNIRKLWDKFKSISGDLLPSRSTATTGQILKLTGENKTPSWADEYTPPAYSETETATGQKWIDGKDIYMRVFSGTFPEITASQSVTITTAIIDKLVAFHSVLKLTNSTLAYDRYYPVITPTTGSTIFSSVTSGYSEAEYTIIEYYTKPYPAPGNREPDQEPEEPEVKETKTTRKKTTK